MSNKPIEIKTDEVFEIFPKAPIAEAVIEIRARAAKDIEETKLRAHLDAVLEGYQYLDSQRMLRHEVKMEKGKQTRQAVQDLGWKGIRYRSTDEKHIVQFNRDGFVFSRLQPYINWSEFKREGVKLWRLFSDFTQPVELHRIGLRFINKIGLPVDELDFEKYIKPAPVAPSGLDLPFFNYLHQDTLAVIGHPYGINIIKTIQRPQTETEPFAIILDIDIFTVRAFELGEEKLDTRLEEMRWLKDKVFFGSITEKTKEMFR